MQQPGVLSLGACTVRLRPAQGIMLQWVGKGLGGRKGGGGALFIGYEARFANLYEVLNSCMGVVRGEG